MVIHLCISERSFTYESANMNDAHIRKIESGKANCYLVRVETGFILIDTGYAKHRELIDAALAEVGCENLQLIVLTHGDFDHVGNSAYLRERHGCKIAMHGDDVGMVEKGDMFWNRDLGRVSRAIGKLYTFIMRIGLDEADMFSPDVLVEDQQSLAEFGFDATVYQLPGHSKGSIGLLTAEGDFFCGDLFNNISIPKKAKLISNHNDYAKSLEVIQQLDIKMVYPGHGMSFSGDALSSIFQEED